MATRATMQNFYIVIYYMYNKAINNKIKVYNLVFLVNILFEENNIL